MGKVSGVWVWVSGMELWEGADESMGRERRPEGQECLAGQVEECTGRVFTCDVGGAGMKCIFCGTWQKDDSGLEGMDTLGWSWSCMNRRCGSGKKLMVGGNERYMDYEDMFLLPGWETVCPAGCLCIAPGREVSG